MKKLLLILSIFLYAQMSFADPVTVQYMPNRVMRPATPGFAAPDLHAFANIAASQTNASVITGTASKVIRVLAIVAVAGGTATDITFNSATNGAISPKFANGANGGEVLPFNPSGWFETQSGDGLTATTGAGSTTGILVTYITY